MKLTTIIKNTILAVGNHFTEVLSSFLLTVIVTAVFACSSRRTPCSAATYRPLIDVLITLFTANHHDVKLQKTNGSGFFNYS